MGQAKPYVFFLYCIACVYCVWVWVCVVCVAEPLFLFIFFYGGESNDDSNEGVP